MSKLVKSMIIREYGERLNGATDAAVLSLRGISANDTTMIRQRLREQDIRVTVVRNALIRKAVEGTPLEALDPVLEGSCAFAFGAESVVDVARALVGLQKEYEKIELRGASLDGQLFPGEEGVKALSAFPTREEAIGKVVTLALSPGRNLMGQIRGPGSTVAGLVAAIKDKLEDGEEIKAA